MYWEGKLIKLPPFILSSHSNVCNSINWKNYVLLDNNECRLMSWSQRYRAAHKGTGRQTNDTGRRTKGLEGNRREPNVVHIQLWLFSKVYRIVCILQAVTLCLLKTVPSATRLFSNVYWTIKKGNKLVSLAAAGIDITRCYPVFAENSTISYKVIV